MQLPSCNRHRRMGTAKFLSLHEAYNPNFRSDNCVRPDVRQRLAFFTVIPRIPHFCKNRRGRISHLSSGFHTIIVIVRYSHYFFFFSFELRVRTRVARVRRTIFEIFSIELSDRKFPSKEESV